MLVRFANRGSILKEYNARRASSESFFSVVPDDSSEGEDSVGLDIEGGIHDNVI